jgi:hypothetical protein
LLEEKEANMAKGKMQSVSVKPKKDSMAKNVSDHMGPKAGPGKAMVTGGKSGGKKK